MREIFDAARASLEQGQSAALMTIIRADARWRIGAKMLVRANGSRVGDLRDADLTDLIHELARAAIATGQSRRVALIENNGELIETQPGEQSDVDVFIEILHANPTLLLIGAGHIGNAIVKLAKLLAWRVVVVDDRPEFIAPERLPDVDERILIAYEPSSETLAPMPITISPSTFILVATWGWDQPALRQIVHSSAAYIGLVASARKSIIIFRDLIKEGIAPEILARVRVPTGLDLGGETPSEIALAIMAEMLMVHRHASGLPLAQFKGSAIMRQTIKGITS
ncbi:MAG: XdhC family protein [Chloroflexi bacterium]|nr:XdhC family protein [Chloroflexota bacterium]